MYDIKDLSYSNRWLANFKKGDYFFIIKFESAEDTLEPLSDEIIYSIVSEKHNEIEELDLPQEFEVMEELILLSEAKKSYSNLFK
jgi:hypothetical protein